MRQLVKKIAGPPYFAARRWVNRNLIERWLGVETAEEVELADLGLEGDGRHHYEASGWLDLRRILRREEVGPEDVFIDIGSGKGRVVLDASRYPFARVIGLELSEELNEVARVNVERFRDRALCQDIEIVTGDATEYELPDDVTIVYIYNSFHGEIFETMIDRILESVDRNPRFLRLIYRTPLQDEYLARSGRIKLVKMRPGFRPGRQWQRTASTSMYVVLPSSLQRVGSYTAPPPAVAAE
jgi:SAM-dependent methyltransferase